MPPRIRSFLPRPLFVRERKAPAEAPRVFREFVETLQKLDAVRHPPGNGAAKKRACGVRRNGTRRHPGNGHARPRSRGPRRYS